MFYDELNALCIEKGIAVTTMIKELGMSSGNLSKWKNGGIPKGQTLHRIAEYLGVSTDYLLGKRHTDDEELNEYLEELKNRSEMRMLFKLAKGATKEDVEEAVRIIEALHK